MASVGVLEATIKANTSDAERAFERFADKADDSAKRAEGAGKLIAGIGGVMAAGLGVAAAAAAGAVASFAGFEQTISAIGAVSGASRADLDALSATALKLGKETSFSAKEAAQGMEELAKAGLSVEAIIGGGAAAALDLAAAGGVSVADAAAIASTAMTVFNKDASEMGGVVDRIAGFANATAGSVTDFKFAMSASGAVAAMVGMSFEDTAAAITAMGKAGILGQDAGTSLKTMLTNLTPKTNAAREAFWDYGLTTISATKAAEELALRGITPAGDSLDAMLKQLMKVIVGTDDLQHMTKKQAKSWGEFVDAALSQNRFFDESTGKIKSLEEIAGILNEQLGDLGKEEQLQALYKVFGSDAIRAGSVLMKAGAEGIREINEELTKVSASEVAKQRLDNLSGSFEQMKGSAETLAIIFGSRLAPGIRVAVDAVTGFLNAMIDDEGLQAFVEELGTGLGNAINSAIEGFGRLKDVLTSTGGDRAGAFAAMGFSPEEAELLGAAFDDLQLKLTAFAQSAVQAGQEMGASLGPALLAAKDGAFALAQAWAALDPETQSLVTTLATLPVQLLLAVATLQPLRDAWSSNFLEIREKTQAAADAVGTFAGAVRDGNWDDAFSGIGTAARTVSDAVVETFQSLSDTVASTFDAAATAVGDALNSAGSLVSEFVGNVVSAGGEMIAAVAEWVRPFVEWAEGFTHAVSVITQYFALEFLGWIGEQAGNIGSAIAGWTAPLVEWGAGIWNAVAPAVASFVSGIIEWGASVLGPIGEAAGQWKDAASKWLGEAWDTVTTSIAAFVSGITQFTTDVGTPIQEGATNWLKVATEWAGKLWDQVSGPLTAFTASIIKEITDAGGKLLTEAGKMASNIISGFVDGIKNGGSAAVKAVQSWAESVIQAAKDKYDIHSPSLIFEDIGANVVEGFTQGIDKEKGSAVNSVVAWINEIIGAANEALQNSPSKVWEEIGRGTAQGYIMGVLSQQQNAIEASLTLVEASARSFNQAILGPMGDMTTEQARKIRDVVEAAAKAQQKALDAVAVAQQKAAEATKAGTEAARQAAQQAAASADAAVNSAALAARKVQETVADVQAQMAKSAQKAAEDAAKAAQKVADEAEKAAKKAADEAKKAIEDEVKAAKEAMADLKDIMKKEVPAIADEISHALGRWDWKEMADILSGKGMPFAAKVAKDWGDEFAKQLKLGAKNQPGGFWWHDWMPTIREPGLQKLLKQFADDVVKAAATALKTSMTADQIFSGHWDYLINSLTAEDGVVGKMVKAFDEGGKKAGKALKEGVVQTIAELNALGPVNLDNLLPQGHGGPPGNGQNAYNAIAEPYRQQFSGMGGQDIIAFLQGKGLNPGELIGPYLQGTMDLATFQQKAAEWFAGIMASGLWSPTSGFRQPISGVDSPYGGYGGGAEPSGATDPAKLARGGIVNRPTYAMVGEGGQREVVSPLDEMFGMIRDAVRSELSAMGGGGLQSVTIPVYVGEREVDRVVYDAQRRALRRAY